MDRVCGDATFGGSGKGEIGTDFLNTEYTTIIYLFKLIFVIT